MFEHHNNLNEKGAPRTAPARSLRGRAQYAALTPSCSNTRGTINKSGESRSLGVGFDVSMADNTESGKITYDRSGKNPRLITTPLPFDTASPKVAHIDWLSFTFIPVEDDYDFVLTLLSQLASLFGLPSIPATTKGGGNGYATMYQFTNGHDVNLGQIAFGGVSQRGTILVALNGSGCALIRDWAAVKSWLQLLNAKITRVDLAHDDIEGKVFTMDKMADWFKQGLFICGGRLPSGKVQGDWLTDGSPSGRTLEVGKRTNGKMLRIYEKGKQLGDSVSPWVRVELELHGKDRDIPFAVLTSPGNYLAASFNCLNFLSVVQEKIRTISKAATISYAYSVQNLRRAGGKLLNLMMLVAGGDAFQVISDLVRDGYPERLKSYAELLPQIYAGGVT